MSCTRLNNYQQSGARLLKHLDDVLHPDFGYPDKPSWGYAFTYLAAISEADDANKEFAQKALRHLVAQDSSDPNYSWEFVVYAIQTSRNFESTPIPVSIDGYHEKGTRMFNWFLLRKLNKKLCGRYGVIDHLKLRLSALIYQESSGLILDEFRTRSFQYHAFCLFVLAELIEADSSNKWLRKWFSSGVDFSMRQILKDGTSLYIGRGQEQIFGYGALLYAIEFCHARIRQLNEESVNLVSKRLLSFQREDGSYPLVLRAQDSEPPGVNFAHDKPPGWYGYNTLYDYQPFLAYCLLKASKLK